jgi:hypothetical protein
MGSGKRDFSEFNAKLEKHIERLPDYAQRAQEKLQRYFPPEQSRPGQDRSGQPQSPGSSRSPRPGRSQWQQFGKMPVPATAADLPVVHEVRSKWAAWNAPEAKLARRKRRTSRALTLWIVLTILCGLYAIAAFTGVLGASAGESQAITALAGVVVFGALGVRSGVRLHGLHKTRLPVASGPAPLPPVGSAAREPMERLAECEESLAELLRQLSASSDTVGSTGVPEVSVEDARNTAREAAAALRGLAARIQAIERARRTSPASEASALDSAVSTLREQLDDGIEGYGGLVAAAGRAVAAAGGGVGASKEALTDATDRLAGLAIALRELS